MASGHACFVPSRAEPSSVTSASESFVGSTNLKCDTGNTEDGLCNWIQLKAVNVLFVSAWMWRTTSAKAAPYLITVPTDFSIGPLISGEYSSSNPSSFWSDERRASAYANIINWRRWTVAKVRTVGLAESRNSREQLCFPMTTPSGFSIRYTRTGW